LSIVDLTRSTLPIVLHKESDPDWINEFKKLAFEKLSKLSVPDSRLESWRKVKFNNLNLTDLLISESSLSVSLNSIDDKIRLSKPAEISNIKTIENIKNNLSNILNSNNFYKLISLAYNNLAYVIDIPDNYSSIDPLILESSFNSNSKSAILLLIINVGKNSNFVLHDKLKSAYRENLNFYNSYTITNLGEGAQAEIIHEENFNDSNFHIRNIEYNHERDSKSTIYYFNLDGYKGKTFIESNLNKKGSESILYGIAVPAKKEIQDIEVSLNHLDSYTSSSIKLKTVMKDKSHHIFTGNLNIPRTSLHVTASQLNNNLVLDKTSRAESMPKLEVFADDVKCSHGATMSEINEDQLFYLMSRGLTLSDSRHLIVEGFITEILDKLKSNTISQDLKDKFLRKIGF
jgi:uncharacterized protein